MPNGSKGSCVASQCAHVGALPRLTDSSLPAEQCVEPAILALKGDQRRFVAPAEGVDAPHLAEQVAIAVGFARRGPQACELDKTGSDSAQTPIQLPRVW